MVFIGIMMFGYTTLARTLGRPKIALDSSQLLERDMLPLCAAMSCTSSVVVRKRVKI